MLAFLLFINASKSHPSLLWNLEPMLDAYMLEMNMRISRYERHDPDYSFSSSLYIYVQSRPEDVKGK